MVRKASAKMSGSNAVALVPTAAAKGTRKRLTDGERAEMLRLSAEKMTGKDIAAKFGVSLGTVYSVIRPAKDSISTETPASATGGLTDIQRKVFDIGLYVIENGTVPDDLVNEVKSAMEADKAEALKTAEAKWKQSYFHLT